MCLLIYKPSNVSVPSANLLHAARVNPDGAGIAYYRKRKVHVVKSPRWSGNDVVRELERIADAPAIIHFRMATHGSVSRDNAHPFSLPHGHAAAHNGVIPGMTCRPDESDTRAFLRDFVAPYLDKSGDVSPSLLSRWGKEVGCSNKLAIMAPTGKVHLINESSGTWIDGAWYSNTYSLPFSASPSAKGGSESRGWWNQEDGPTFMQWHDAPHCAYCLSWVNAVNGFGTMDDGSLICESCAEKL